MRLGYVGPLPPLRGGIAQHGLRTVEALRGLGHDVVVAAWRAQYPKVLYPGAETRADRLVADAAPLDWWSPWSWWQAGEHLRGVDALVVPWVVPFQAVAYRTVARAARAPVVAVVHNALPHEPHVGARHLARWFLDGARGYVVHADGVAQDVRELTGWQAGIVPHPPNLDLSPRPLPEGPPWRLLCLGYVRRYKGVDLAVAAVRQLRDRGLDVELTVAGEVWEGGPELRRAVTDLGLGGHVELVDRYVSDGEVAGLLAAHHVVVAPYRSATQSGVAPLAFAAGRPVVATRVGGLPESIPDGVAGVIVEPEDVDGLADGIVAAIADLERLAGGARRSSSDWSDVARAIVLQAQRAVGVGP